MSPVELLYGMFQKFGVNKHLVVYIKLRIKDSERAHFYCAHVEALAKVHSPSCNSLQGTYGM
jgi:hypothetical protein